MNLLGMTLFLPIQFNFLREKYRNLTYFSEIFDGPHRPFKKFRHEEVLAHGDKICLDPYPLNSCVHGVQT